MHTPIFKTQFSIPRKKLHELLCNSRSLALLSTNVRLSSLPLSPLLSYKNTKNTTINQPTTSQQPAKSECHCNYKVYPVKPP